MLLTPKKSNLQVNLVNAQQLNNLRLRVINKVQALKIKGGTDIIGTEDILIT